MKSLLKPSYSLTFNDAVEIWRRHWNHEFQHRIAADYDVNPGRINAIRAIQSWCVCYLMPYKCERNAHWPGSCR